MFCVLFRMKELREHEALQVKYMDAGCKCSWNWVWLKLDTTRYTRYINEEKCIFSLSHVIKKIDKKGHARCSLCMKEINYANKGSWHIVN